MEAKSSCGSREIVVIIGIQGAGKSTYCREFTREKTNYHHINRDDIRRICFPDDIKWDDTYWHEGHISEIEDIAIDIALGLGKDIILDEGLHCFKGIREATVKRLKANYPDARLTAVVILCEFTKAVARNRQRAGKDCVPEKTISHFQKSLTAGLGGALNSWTITETLVDEGFDNIEILFN